jgi:hypothetical protein
MERELRQKKSTRECAMYGAPFMAVLIFTDNADFDTKNLRLSVFYRCNLRLRILNLLTVFQHLTWVRVSA